MDPFFPVPPFFSQSWVRFYLLLVLFTELVTKTVARLQSTLGVTPATPPDSNGLDGQHSKLTEEKGMEYLELYRHELYRYIYKFIGDQDKADDVFQDICYTVWDLINKKPIYDQNIKGWIFRIAASLCKKEIRTTSIARKNLVYSEGFEEMTGSEEMGPDATYEVNELTEKLDVAVRKLPNELRTVFILKHVNQYSQTDIAEMLGVSQMAISRRLSKAVKQLGQLMDGWT